MISPTGQFPQIVSPEFSPEMRRGLEQLVRALEYARDLESPEWEFAVEIERLLAVGMTTSDLRWLVKRGYLSHAREVTASQDADRRFEPPAQNLAFAANTCFVIAEAGLAILGKHAEPNGETMAISMANAHGRLPADSQIDLPARELAAQAAHQVVLPNWDRATRTFLLGDYLIKRFRVPSPNQEAVLEAFQEEGWPASVDDPLSPVADYDPKRRLRDTIKCLNLNQAARLIRFRGDGTGQRVQWEMMAESASSADSIASEPLRRAA